MVRDPAEAYGLVMTRFERDQFFEALCRLRDAYAVRSDADRRSTLLIGDAIVYAEAVMRALAVEDLAAAVAIDAGIAQEAIRSADPRS